MKMNKKSVLFVALLVCAAAILSLGTLAWFNATDEITNKFMIADSNGDGTPDFSVEVWENENDGDDTADADGDQDPVKTHAGNEYDTIAPGDKLAKNPTVENTGDYDQWIRVYVTFDEYSEIKNAYDDEGLTFDLREWLDVTSEWTADDTLTTVADNKVTYGYYLNRPLTNNGDLANLFTTVSIPTWFEQDDMQYVSGNFTITVKAEAIQTANTLPTAKETFEAYWG